MRAIIMAGGRGERLAPLTTRIPKPVLLLGDTTILEIIIRQLSHAGFQHITLTLAYMGDKVKNYIENHKSLNRLVRVDFVEDKHETGTAGSVSLVPGLDEAFLMMNGDILTDLDYRMMVDFHRSCKACLTIAVQRKTINVEFGVLTTDAEGLVTNYIEKPNFDYIISMGVYVCEPVVLTYIPIGEYFDFNTLVIKLIKMNKKVVVFYSDAYWIDLGRPEDLQRATNWFMANKGRFLPCTLDDGFQPDKV